jgi:hypothetical protein
VPKAAWGQPTRRQRRDEVQKLNADLLELALNRIIVGLGRPERAISPFKTYLARKGGETAVPVEHPPAAPIEEQENAITAEEEAMTHSQADGGGDEEAEAAAEAESGRRRRELQKQQFAKGKDARTRH